MTTTRPTTAVRRSCNRVAPAVLPPPVSQLGSAAIAGGAAGVLFGAVMPATEMMPSVAALYGADGVTAGWAIHLVHSMVFGVLFLLATSALRTRLGVAASGVVGALYSVLLWVVAASFVMPIWMGAVTDMEPSVPTWNWLSLVGHIAYGATLGVLVPVLRLAEERSLVDAE